MMMLQKLFYIPYLHLLRFIVKIGNLGIECSSSATLVGVLSSLDLTETPGSDTDGVESVFIGGTDESTVLLKSV